jgi:putative two-component system response regulator
MLVAYGPEPDPGIADLKAVVQLTKECAPAQHPEALAALVQALEANGRADEALVYLHDMLAQTRVRLSEQLSAQLPPEAADLDNDGYATLLASKAATLQVSVARRIGELQKSAVIGSEQAGHDRLRIFRVSRLAELFAMELGWDPDRAARLGFAATVMDAGLAVLPRGLAIKRRGLSVAERRMVHEHVTAGADLLAAARLTVLEPCIPVARFHHERWDGGGPLGLAGEAIPIEARIASLADAFDALTHDRPWRGAMTAAAALRTIAEGAGTQFDPNLAPRFVASVKAMYWDHDKLDDYLAESAAKYDLPYLATRNELDQLIAAGGAA